MSLIQKSRRLSARSLEYKKSVIRSLSFGKSLASVNISAAIDKSLPLTNKILASLIKDEIVREDGLADSTGGRRAVNYSLRSGKCLVLSVAIDQYITKISLIDLAAGEVQLSNLRKYELQLQNNLESAAKLIDIIRDYIREMSIDTRSLMGLGIGMPGFVDVEKGKNYSFLAVPLSNSPSLSQYIEDAVGVPTLIDNDSTTIALAEKVIGAATGTKNSLVINYGWGVGLGMILNGEWFRGSYGLAGEFSHIPLFNNNKLCQCGKTGCLETESSMLKIIDDFRSAVEAGRASRVTHLSGSLEDASASVIQSVQLGDPLAVEIFSEAFYKLGRGIAVLIHLLNPDQIIISGRGAEAGPVILAPVYQAINKYCIPRLASYTKILLSDIAGNSALYGAAALISENISKKHFRMFNEQIIITSD